MIKNNNDIFEGSYRYFRYPINDISNIFELGIPIKGFTLEGRIASDSFNEANIQNYLAPYRICSSKYICILKIPSYYFGHRKKDGDFTPCMPLINTYFDYMQGEKNYVIPDLILGIYNTETGEYTENHKYSPIFNPAGLQFTDEQIEFMKKFGAPMVADYALVRRNIPYWTLLKQDEDNGVLDPVVGYYGFLARHKPHVRGRDFHQNI